MLKISQHPRDPGPDAGLPHVPSYSPFDDEKVTLESRSTYAQEARADTVAAYNEFLKGGPSVNWEQIIDFLENALNQAKYALESEKKDRERIPFDWE